MSAPVEHFRREVSARAFLLARRRRRSVGGVVAVVLLVVATLSWRAIAPGGAPVSRVATGPTAATPATGGGAGPVGPDAPSRTGRPYAALPPATGGSTAVTVVINDPPVGRTTSVDVGMEATVVLAAPVTGTWGTARITRGSGSVLVLVRQVSDTGGGTRVTVRAVGDGAAGVMVPCVGHLSDSWHGSVTVSGPAGPPGQHPG